MLMFNSDVEVVCKILNECKRRCIYLHCNVYVWMRKIVAFFLFVKCNLLLQSYVNNTKPYRIPERLRQRADPDGDDRSSSTSLNCHGLWYDALLVVPSLLFLLYLAFHAKKNLKKLSNGSSYIMISYYALVWVAALLNLSWSALQGWQCSGGKAVAWNVLCLFTASAMMCLEISLVAFLLQDNYRTGVDALAQTFLISGIVVSVDMLLKAIYVFGFGVPLFMVGIGGTTGALWGLWFFHKLLLTAVYGFILFVHFSKWREKLPPRPAFYNYILIMFAFGAVTLLACGLAGIRAGFGIWLYNLTDICYHSLYLPFLYVTFLADFFQEEEFLLDNAYYSEMKDAGFFDADWD